MICAVVAAVCALAFVGCTGFQNDGEQADPIPDSGVYDSEGNMLVSGEVYDVNRGLVFAMPTAESMSASEGITLQATIEPEAAKDWPLEWSVLAAPGVSDCAECKEKIKLEPAGRTCVVKCEGNFLHCFAEMFREEAARSGRCIEDYPTYRTERASIGELELQNSYFVRDVLQAMTGSRSDEDDSGRRSA